MRRWVPALIAILLGLSTPSASRAQALVADLSNHLVAITSGFNGAEILLFGAVEGPGDVVVTVRGPADDEVVRRKIRMAGLWVNGPEVAFQGVPEAKPTYTTAQAEPAADLLLLQVVLAGEPRVRSEVVEVDDRCLLEEVADDRAAAIGARHAEIGRAHV